jgi:glucans biosynthesis protein C
VIVAQTRADADTATGTQTHTQPPVTTPPWSTPRPASARASSGTRLAYLDALKVALTVLVVVHHVGQAFGPTCGRWPVFDTQRTDLLGPLFAVDAAFFMGLFFFISALFVPIAFDRKGAFSFLRDRAFRLGVPLVVVSLGAFAPLGYTAYAATGGSLSFPAYVVQIYLGQWQVDVGHLWFLEHLLVYALVYAGWRIATERRPHAWRQRLPGDSAIAAFVVLLGAVTAVVRFQFPIDRWINLFGVVPTEPAHLPQYAALFCIGLVAARANWLERMPTRRGLKWLALGALAAALWIARPDWLGRNGLSSALLWSFCESLICVGLSIGLLTAFRASPWRPGRIAGWLAPNAFAVYVLHVFPVVALQALIIPTPLPPLVKFACVSIVAVPLCFALAAGLRRLPGTRSVL